MTPLPNFFIVGAPKAATTAAFYYLRQHPDVFMSPIKEPFYFVSEFRPEVVTPEWRERLASNAAAFDAYIDNPRAGRRPPGVVTEWNQYLKLFRHAREGQAIGEGSTAYMWSRTAARGIADAIPGARILMILRNPADRAFSQYLQRVSGGRTDRTFGHTIRQLASEMSTASAVGPLDVGTSFSHIQKSLNMLELGAYAAQVERFLDVFPRERIAIYLYEEFARSAAGVIRDMFRFLGVRDDVPIDVSKRYMEPKVPRFPAVERHVVKPLVGMLPDVMPRQWRRSFHRLRFLPRQRIAMPPADRRFLIDFYADDVRRLSRLIGRDLSHWLAYDEPAVRAVHGDRRDHHREASVRTPTREPHGRLG